MFITRSKYNDMVARQKRLCEQLNEQKDTNSVLLELCKKHISAKSEIEEHVLKITALLRYQDNVKGKFLDVYQKKNI